MSKNLAMKAARASKDMTQKELAEAVDVSRQTINMIEKGEYMNKYVENKDDYIVFGSW